MMSDAHPNTSHFAGADEDGKAWKLTGRPKGKYVLIDFSPKGGPKEVVAVNDGLGIVFPDGNKWTKK